ncbi:MAG: FAD binding domain-containing protein [Phenylobacterium sp.]|uniref:FAD binding domain-containing protein n=1 Tax=Phenylobacterium sp. TaxID=1871053 RepID=UPI00391DB27D
MIPAAFDYVRPSQVEEVFEALEAQAAGEVSLLAGGQSLLSRLKLREARPSTVVDLGGVESLRRMDVSGGAIVIGAMVSQAEVLRHPFVCEHLSLLLQAGAAAGDPMIRNRGTLVGALCAAEVSGDWVAAVLALDAVVHIAGRGGVRHVPISDFVRGPGAVELAPAEFVTAVSIPAQSSATKSLYRKRKHHGVGWSVVSLALSLEMNDQGRCRQARVAISGAGTFPQRLPHLEEKLVGVEMANLTQFARQQEGALPDLEARTDRWASGDYRARMLDVLLRRALLEIGGDTNLIT